MRSLFATFLLFGLIYCVSGEEEAVTEEVVDGFSTEDREKMKASGETHEFQAEVNRLMDIIINSLYTHKEVFLRELISNAADALEKARLSSVQNEDFLGANKDLEIKVDFDESAHTLSITDTGIGMSKADLINNLGTVAKSGTTNFLEAIEEGVDANLIGQFGVGFYSAFLVADRIAVTSKSNDDNKQHVWESSADASFIVTEDPRGATLGRGTRVTLFLKEDAHDYLSEQKLRDTIEKFSKFIQFPISLRVKKEVDADLDEDDDETEEETDDDVDVKDDEGEKEEEKDAPKKKIVYEWEQVNTQKPIWLRAKEDVTDEEYTEFYKSVSKDYLDPLAYTHFNAEGEIEFKSVLFIPKKAPFDMLDNYWTKKSEVKLYVRRVLVAEKFDELLPRYLNFVKGVVDSDDLPLNVSREQLQQNKIMKVISKKLVRKTLEMLKKLAKEEEKDEEAEKEEDEEDKGDKKDKEESDWSVFYKEFSKNLKMGCYEDDSNRSKIAKLLRFATTKSVAEKEDSEISLDKYLDRMQDSQESIYYMSGDNIEVMQKSPTLQVFKKKGIEVLLLADHLDESCIQKLADYEGKKFVSIQKSDVKLEETDSEKKRFSKLKDMYKPLTDWLKDELTTVTESGPLKSSGVKIESVTVSKRLVDSPCVVVTSQFGYSAHQEKIMRAQAFQNKDQLNMMAGRKTLEINPNHPVMVDLLEKVKNNESDQRAKDSALVLFQAALLDSGYDISDPSVLVARVYRLMSRELGVDPDAPLQEIELPEDEEEVVEEEAEEGETEEAEAEEPEEAADEL